MKFDKALTPHPSGTVLVQMPASVGRALRERGFDRTTIEVTAEGILLVPYRGNGAKYGASVVDLPEWGQ